MEFALSRLLALYLDTDGEREGRVKRVYCRSQVSQSNEYCYKLPK